MYEEHFHDINQAIAWEEQLKGWSRKKRKLCLEEIMKKLKNWQKLKMISQVVIHLLIILRQAHDDNVGGNAHCF